MIVNIITIAVVDGFQQEVRRKVIGFGSHITIQQDGEATLMETSPLRTDAPFEAAVASVKGVQSIQPVAYKTALLQSVTDEEQREILGVVLKGVQQSYDWSFLKEHLKAGRLPQFGNTPSEEILLSRRICNDLHYKLGDTAKAYFVKQQPILRRYKIIGIYETGLEDYDKEMVFCDLRQVQQLNDWGLQASIIVDDTLSDNGSLIVRADVSGGNGRYFYDWGRGPERYEGFEICPDKDTTIRLIVSDYWDEMQAPGTKTVRGQQIPDTAWLEIKVSGNRYSACTFRKDAEGNILRTYADNTGYRFSIDAGAKTLVFRSTPGKGSSHHYIGNYELIVDDWDHVDDMAATIAKKTLLLHPSEATLKVESIRQQRQELFSWLGFLDINMAIILLLMLVIGIINMGSALLVMILVRTNFIGILKSIGTTDRSIRRLFIVLGGRLIVRGMIWGNAIGVGLCVLQDRLGIVGLDAKVYYLNKVPVQLDWFGLLTLNVLTLGICLLTLLVPSVVITRILPSKAIRFR